MTPFRFIALLFALNTAPLYAQYNLPPAPSLSASSYILVDYDTGKVLLEKDANLPQDLASITKIMTVYTVLKEIQHNPALSVEKVTISKNAYSKGGSRMFLEQNSKVTINEVLLGLIIQSGNDAAIALAEHIDGSEEFFSHRMNSYADRLGMNTTHFVNSTGWPHDEQYSSAEDIVRLSIALIQEFPKQYQWFAEKQMTYNGIKQLNRNRLLWRDPTVDGIKTGHSKKAGYCLAASASRGKRRLISVILGAKSDKNRTLQSQKLLNYGFRFYKNVTVQKLTDVALTKRVWFGQSDELSIGVAKDWVVSVPKSIANNLQTEYQLTVEHIEAPIEKGKILGVARIMYKNSVIDEQPIYALSDIPKSGFLNIIIDYIEYFFVYLLSLFSLES